MKNKSKSASKGKSRKRGVDSSPESPGGNVLPDLPDITAFDDVRHCPRYQALLERTPDDDPATSDELDPLQHELEQILMHNMDRQRKLTDQLSWLTSGQHPSTSDMAQDRLTPQFMKRSDTPESKSTTKLTIRTPGSARMPKQNADSTFTNIPVPHYDVLGRRRIFFWPQNHMPDKFWQFVSEHCVAVDPEDIKVIKQQLKDTADEKMAKYYRIPGLGKHYSLRWSEEDSQKEMRRSGKTALSETTGPSVSKVAVKRKLSSSDSTDSKSMSKKPKSSLTNGHATQNGDHYSLGSLTERLVQALVEEQSTPILSGNAASIEPKDIPELNGMNASPNKALVRSLNLGNMAALERRIKRELEAQGLLDGDDGDDLQLSSSSKTQDDEVTAELRQRQEELRSITEVNRHHLHFLCETSEKQQDRNEIETKIKTSDKEILDLHNRFYSMVPKRKPCNKKERDTVSNAIEERTRLMQKLTEIE